MCSLIDLLLISHAHADHFDYPSFRDIQSDKTSVITTKNTKELWDGLRYESVNELDLGKSKNIKGVTVTAIEGEHWGARLPWNQSMTANSYLISKRGNKYFLWSRYSKHR